MQWTSIGRVPVGVGSSLDIETEVDKRLGQSLGGRDPVVSLRVKTRQRLTETIREAARVRGRQDRQMPSRLPPPVGVLARLERPVQVLQAAAHDYKVGPAVPVRMLKRHA